MARHVKNNTDIYEFKDRYIRGTKDVNFTKYVPEEFLNWVLWLYMALITVPVWSLFIALKFWPLDLVPISSVAWALPCIFGWMLYEKDRYASVPTTLRAKLLWRYYTRTAHLQVNGKPYHGAKRIVQVKMIHPSTRKQHDNN